MRDNGSQRFAAITNGGLLISALLITGLMIRREFVQAAPETRRTPLVSNMQLSQDLISKLEDGGQVIGPMDAPITLVTFTDYQCPFCGQLEEDISAATQGTILQDSLRIIIRHYPLEAIHPNARAAALAALCAGQRGDFPEFHRALFARKGQLNDGMASLYGSLVNAMPSQLESFERCLSGNTSASQLESDRKLALLVGVSGTPTSVIHGSVVVGSDGPNNWRDRLLDVLKEVDR